MARLDRPPGRDAPSGSAVIPPSRPNATSPQPQQGSTAASVQPAAHIGPARRELAELGDRLDGLAAAVDGRTLPYDQIAPARLVIGDATGRLDGHLGVLGVALAQWMARDDGKPDAPARWPLILLWMPSTRCSPSCTRLGRSWSAKYGLATTPPPPVSTRCSVDQEVVLDLLFGAAEHRLLLGHLPMTDDFIANVVDVIMTGIQRPG